MFLRNFYGLVALLVFCNAQAQRKKWEEDPDSENPNNWINIDSERNNDVDQPFTEYTEKDGSGSGMMVTDDDDILQGSGSGSGSGGPSVPDDEGETDEPPRVNAGPDVVLRWPQQSTTLCGNATTDDRSITKFLWSRPASSLPATMSGQTGICVQLSGLTVGEYTFTLQVTDSGGNTGTDQVRVVVEMAPTTPAPVDKTGCQQLRDVSKHLLGSYIPRCTEKGEYASQQCRGHESTGMCWCVDLDGATIPGTNITPSPDCELGTNLQPCVFKLVQQMRKKLLGTFQPKCSLSGDFEAVQCEGSSCFCVDQKTGVKLHGTEVFKPDQPECDGKRLAKPMVTTSTTATTTTSKTTAATRPLSTTRQPAVPKSTPSPDIDEDEDEGEEREEEEEKEETTQKPRSTDSDPQREPSSAAHMISQPGILAAIIGGSVVLLLCAILLVMFVVYRMRKKDEGSYALDEPKKMPNYSYQRAPDKEFYA